MNPPLKIKQLEARIKSLEQLLVQALPWLTLLEAHLLELGLAEKRAALVEYMATVRKP